MSHYLELFHLDRPFPFQRFVHEGEVLVYPHWHKVIEIIYVTRGVLHLGINDVPIVMQEGEIQFINAGDIHYFLASPNSERIVIQFDASLFHEEESAGDPGLRQLFCAIETHSRSWPAETTAKIRELLAAINQEEQHQAVGYKYMIKAALTEIIALIYRYIPLNPQQVNRPLGEAVASKSEKTLARLDKIFSYIENHYHECISLDDVAKFMGFSACYFARFFKKNTGMTLVRFLHDYRLNQAKWLLLNEEIPVSEIAERVGFNSVKTFHHVFKQNTGIAPLKYRRSISGIK